MEKMNENKNGRVWLVGAGPGDTGLLTLKGKRILEEAQVVVYDALVGTGILGFIPETAEAVYVGKRGGCHEKAQEEINEILVNEGKKGKKVVRLKGGDPFVFGRGSEEAQALRVAGIPFEVVPGVTSAVSVPAYSGIPVTHRGLASSFHVITGHRRAGEALCLDYEGLARLEGTLIFLMGLSAAEEICQGLISAGMDENRPAALLQEGTTAGQKKVVSTLASLVLDGREAGIRPPAILVVGEVCGLESSCKWAETMPLFGRRILVTRPVRRAKRMTESLRSEGADVIELPAVETRLIEDNRALLQAVERMDSFDWLAFTSPSGVELFLQYLRDKRMDIRRLPPLKIAVIGRATGKRLEEAGIYADYMPERFYAASLGEGLAERLSGKERLLILRAKEASCHLTAPLDANGVEYEDIPLYETVVLPEQPHILSVKKLLKEKQFDYITFTSGSTVEGFMDSLHPDADELSGFTAVCIGESTAERAKQWGMRCIVSEVPSVDSMVRTLKQDALGNIGGKQINSGGSQER